MNLFNNIQKVKYTRNQQEVVSLKEYIIFDDENQQSKYVVLKLANNLNQRLYDVKAEISQYDEYEELVEKTVVAYSSKVEENDEFVPKAKLKVNYACKSISFKLIFARFERVKYENGEFYDIEHKFEVHQAKLSPVKQAPIIEVKKDQNKTSKFSSKESYGKNIARFPKFFNGLVCVLSVGFVVGTLFLFKLTTKHFSVDNYDYYNLNDKEIVITSYDGNEKELTIPSSVDGKKVVRILKGAFKNSDIEKLTIKNANFVIESEAFKNCDDLKEIYISEHATMLKRAFVDCDNISRVYMPKTNLLEETFTGINSLESLTFADCTLPNLTSSFALEEGEELSIKKLVSTMENMPVGFLDNTSIGSLDIPEHCSVGYGNYKHVDVNFYKDTGSVELISGKVVSINANDKELVINSNIIELDVDKFSNELSKIKKLKIESDSNVIGENLYRKLINLKEFEINNISYLKTGILDYCSSLSTLIIPVSTSPLADMIGNKENIKHLEFVGSGTLRGPVTANLPYIESVKIDSNITVNDSKLFANSDRITSVEVPVWYSSIRFVDSYPAFQNAKKVVVTAQGNNIPRGYFEGLNNVVSIEVGEGINYINSEIISNSYTLESIKLPQSVVEYRSLPVIGTNCNKLKKVEYSAANKDYMVYKTFNASYAATTQLKVTNMPYMKDAYLEKVTRLNKLHIEGNNINCQGLLIDNKSITDLYIKSENVGVYFSDLFFKGSEVTNNNKILNTLTNVVIDCSSIPESYFEGIKKIENLYLQSVTEVGKNAFKEISGLETLYVPETVELPKSVLSDLKDAGVFVYFEAEEAEYKGYKETGVLFEDVYNKF